MKETFSLLDLECVILDMLRENTYRDDYDEYEENLLLIRDEITKNLKQKKAP